MIGGMLSRESIDHLAALARMDVSEKEKEALLSELDAILTYVSEIQTLAGGEKYDAGALVNANLREDENPHETGTRTEKLTEAFSEKEKDYLKVKKVLPSS